MCTDRILASLKFLLVLYKFVHFGYKISDLLASHNFFKVPLPMKHVINYPISCDKLPYMNAKVVSIKCTYEYAQILDTKLNA